MERKAILQLIKQTVASQDSKATVILFGSRARNDARDDSDWDILVLVDGSTVTFNDYQKLTFPLFSIGWEIGEHFSAKLYSRQEWEKRNFTPFYKNVMKEGVVL